MGKSAEQDVLEPSSRARDTAPPTKVRPRQTDRGRNHCEGIRSAPYLVCVKAQVQENVKAGFLKASDVTRFLMALLMAAHGTAIMLLSLLGCRYDGVSLWTLGLRALAQSWRLVDVRACMAQRPTLTHGGRCSTAASDPLFQDCVAACKAVGATARFRSGFSPRMQCNHIRILLKNCSTEFQAGRRVPPFHSRRGRIS